ncbi:hypothetical protein [Mucilaginibacter aquatilis]|uniref:Uncharacterized protein n=1 Tax=Mucilaginibacter aquatilis TaxID=1517760 RepID=A0A6I4I9S9_9SPHI|nr:hypothetical protein [Mucilaginibacter aquatilis]MVN90226.1 hypothetical protein [Mucilaginibacter aquatilis]
MKIVHTTAPVNVEDLKSFLENDLNTKFKEHRHLDVDLKVVLSGNSLDISIPDLYDDFLFRIEAVNNDELHIIKSEHYTDDVNVLTIEEIMNNLMLDYPGRDNIDYVGEKS